MKTKTFDCVKMKEDIQAKLLIEHEGKTDREIWESILNKINTDNTKLGEFWRNLMRKKGTQSIMENQRI